MPAMLAAGQKWMEQELVQEGPWAVLHGRRGAALEQMFPISPKNLQLGAGDASASMELGQALAWRGPELLLHSAHNNVARRDVFYGDINPRSNGLNASHHPRCVLAASITYTPVDFIAAAA